MLKDHKIAVNGWKDESACELFPFLKVLCRRKVFARSSVRISTVTVCCKVLLRLCTKKY